MWRVFLMLSTAMPFGAAAGCRLCAADVTQAERRPSRPIAIDIVTALDFSRVAQRGTGGGSVTVDERSGARRVAGGLIDIGGMALSGEVHISGEPLAHVRVTVPQSISLSGSEGASARVESVTTDLGPDPMLNGSGELVFRFGGRLIVNGDATGDFRGHIPISADYL